MEDSLNFDRLKLTPEEIAEKNAKHRFKKEYVFVDDEKQNVHENLVENFVWNDEDDSEEVEGTETLKLTEEQVQQCANAILAFLSENLSFANFNTYETGIEITVQVPASIHAVLQERFSTRWTLDSSIEQFDRVRDVLDGMLLHPELIAPVNARLQSVLPPAQSSWQVTGMYIDDDNVVLGGQGKDPAISVSVQIGKYA